MHNHCPAPSTGLSPITSQKGGAGAKVHQLGFLAGRGQARLGSRRSKHFPAQNAKIPGKTGSDFSGIHVVEKVAFWQTLVLGARPTKTWHAQPKLQAYNFCAGARWGESKLTQWIISPSQGDLHHGLVPKAPPVPDVTMGVSPRPRAGLGWAGLARPRLASPPGAARKSDWWISPAAAPFAKVIGENAPNRAGQHFHKLTFSPSRWGGEMVSLTSWGRWSMGPPWPPWPGSSLQQSLTTPRKSSLPSRHPSAMGRK